MPAVINTGWHFIKLGRSLWQKNRNRVKCEVNLGCAFYVIRINNRTNVFSAAATDAELMLNINFQMS